MPVTYFSSTGGISFVPVPRRDQAVGPLEVAFIHSSPDEIIEPRRADYFWLHSRSEAMPSIGIVAAIATLFAMGVLL